MSLRRIENLDELKALANEIAASAGLRLVVLLDGPMGAGKTQFTKFLLEAIGVNDVVSPSFAIHNSYATTTVSVHHFDLFRLESADDLESTGFWDLFDQDEGWIIIEWAEKLNDFGLWSSLPKAWAQKHLRFEGGDSSARLIEIKT